MPSEEGQLLDLVLQHHSAGLAISIGLLFQHVQIDEPHQTIGVVVVRLLVWNHSMVSWLT